MPTHPHQLPAISLRHRVRAATADELRRVPWWPLLDDEQRRRAGADMQVADAEPGEFLCRIGRPATLWLGVVEGLLKMSNDSAMGPPITFTGVPSGRVIGIEIAPASKLLPPDAVASLLSLK